MSTNLKIQGSQNAFFTQGRINLAELPVQLNFIYIASAAKQQEKHPFNRMFKTLKPDSSSVLHRI